MVMPHQARRLVCDRGTAPEHPVEVIEVLAATRWRPGTEVFIERADPQEHVPADGETRAGADHPAVEWLDDRVGGSAIPTEQLRGEVRAPRDLAFEYPLGVGCEVSREYESGDEFNIVCTGESAHEFADPVGIHLHIVIGEGDDLAGGVADPSVARSGQARDRLADVSDPRVVARPHQLTDSGCARRVVDDDDLERRIVR